MIPELYINGRFLTQQTTGVQSFARSICHELALNSSFKLLVPATGMLQDNDLHKYVIRRGWTRGHFWEQISLPHFIRKQHHAVLLNLCNTGPLQLKNQVVTIHDLAFIKNPSWFHPLFARYYSWLLPRLAANCKAVITVSETVKEELITTFRLPREKIFVTSNKISDSLLSCRSETPAIKELSPKNFFLMVGSSDPRKNFTMVEELFRHKFPKIPLIIAGGSHRSFKDRSLPAQGTNVIRLGYTENKTLKWLYENALGFINPSLYEGFGIPNLEAFAFECPVICSNIPVFREICGSAVWYFDPLQTSSLEKLILQFLSESQFTSEKTSAGKVIFTSFQNKNRSQILLKAIAL